nr:histidine kinase N-terminal 7TM domain-containing protein [Natranaeroarchaeum aerophilus]
MIPAIGICLAMAIYGWRKRPVPGASSFSAFMFGGGLWAVAVLGIRTTPGPTTELFWSLFQYFGIVLLPPAWLVFALDYTSRDRWITPSTIAILSVLPVGTLVALWTNDLHRLFYDPTTTETVASASIAGMPYGPLFYAMVTWAYLFILVGSAMLVHLLITAPKRYRVRIVAVLVAIAAPLVSNLLYLVGVLSLPVDPAPYAFAVSGLVFGWALFGHELFDVPPVAPKVAHTIVFDQTDNGVLILDAGGYVVDHNDAATELLDLPSDPDGKRLEDVIPSFAEQLSKRDGETVTDELSLSTEPRRYLKVTSTPIRRRSDRKIGTLLTMDDITDQRLREQRLDVLQRVLRHNVRQETNKILGYTEFLEDEVDGDEKSEHADAINRAAHSLIEWSTKARSIDRTLGPDADEKRVFEVESTIDAILEDATRTHPGAEIDADVPTSETIRCHTSIEKALYEIIDNAIRHNDSDEPSVTVSAEVEDEWVTISISDDGSGLPAMERDVLDRGRETPLEHGSGLGLWLVNWSVTASGGSVSIDTDEGTTVRIRVPRANVGAETAESKIA